MVDLPASGASLRDILSNRAAVDSPAQALFASTKKSARHDHGNNVDNGAAVTVALSSHAKALMARSQETQAVAQHLEATMLGAGKGASPQTGRLTNALQPSQSGKDQGANAKADEIMAKYGNLPQAEVWAARARADNLGLLNAGVKGFDLPRMEANARKLLAGGEVFEGTESMSDDALFVHGIQSGLAQMIVGFEKNGQNDKAQALRAAINNGTVKVQKTDDVPELNLTYTETHFADAGGGGSTGSMTWNPSGNAKALLDEGRAQWVGGGDRGSFFLSW